MRHTTLNQNIVTVAKRHKVMEDDMREERKEAHADIKSELTEI